MPRPRSSARVRAAGVAAVLCLLGGAPAVAAPPLYVRGGLGWDQSEDLVLRDRNCASEQPPALFGCGPGSDGRPMAARGDGGSSERWELGLGAEVGTRWRVELALGTRDLELAADANFRGVSGAQPVRADGRSSSALLAVAVDVGPARWRLRPFLAAGAGAARNELADVVYSFPSIAPDAVTVVRGGDHTDLAWTVAVGLAFRLRPALHLDLDVRHIDLGELRTAAGPATIVRPRGTFDLAIDGTRADLATRGVGMSLRWRPGAAARP